PLARRRRRRRARAPASRAAPSAPVRAPLPPVAGSDADGADARAGDTDAAGADAAAWAGGPSATGSSTDAALTLVTDGMLSTWKYGASAPVTSNFSLSPAGTSQALADSSKAIGPLGAVGVPASR